MIFKRHWILTMPNTRKWTDSQREVVKSLYLMGRNLPGEGEYSKGRFTLKQISERTGVTICSVYKIAHS